MYDPEMRKDCPMRGNLGNCSPVGGFCMDAVSDEICEAVHNAYQQGYGHAISLLKAQKPDYKAKVPVQSLIDHIKTAIDVDPWAKEMAEQLLQKEIPVKPIFVKPYYDCGACKKYSVGYGYNVVGVRYAYCANCGRRVDWE